jgi:hypothetical protein
MTQSHDDLELRRSCNELAAARFLAPVLRFHEQAAEDERTKTELVEQNLLLRRLLAVERRAVGRYQYRLRCVRRGIL